MFNTKMRYVNIYRYWLRDEIFEKKTFKIEYLETKLILIDGLTKVLGI